VAKEFTTLRALIFIAGVVVLLLGNGPVFAIHSPVPPTEQPTGVVPDGHDHDDDIRLAHDYIVSGLALRGPLREVCERFLEIENEGDGMVPSLRVSYISKSWDGETSAMAINSFGELKRFLTARSGVRKALAKEITNLGPMSLEKEYRISSIKCDGTGLQDGFAETQRLGLDYRLSLENTEAAAVSFAGTFLMLTLNENPIMMFGHVDNGTVELQQVGGACTVKLVPVGGGDWIE